MYGQASTRRRPGPHGDRWLPLGRPRSDRRALDREALTGEVDVVQPVPVDEPSGRLIADLGVVPAVPVIASSQYPAVNSSSARESVRRHDAGCTPVPDNSTPSRGGNDDMGDVLSIDTRHHGRYGPRRVREEVSRESLDGQKPKLWEIACGVGTLDRGEFYSCPHRSRPDPASGNSPVTPPASAFPIRRHELLG